MPLPASIQYGYVVWTALLAVADTTGDPDRLPDATPATGTVRFSPLVQSITASDGSPVSVVPQIVTATIDGAGRMIDPAGALGVWLVAGQYDVSFSFAAVTLPPFRIEVTAGHTAEAPLDLTLAAPLVPSPAEKWVVNEQVYTDTLAARDAAQATASGMVVSGSVSGDDLVLARADGSTVTAGNVRGPKGDPGDAGPVGPSGGPYQYIPPVGQKFSSGFFYTSTTSQLRARDSSPMPLLLSQTISIDAVYFNVTTPAATVGQTARVDLVWLGSTGVWNTLLTLGSGIDLTSPAGERSATFAPIELSAGVVYGFKLWEPSPQSFDSALRVTQGLIHGPGTTMGGSGGYAVGFPVGTNHALVTGVPFIKVRRSA